MFNDFAAAVKFNALAAVAKVFNQFSGGNGSSIFSISLAYLKVPNLSFTALLLIHLY
jgi:hypothetical protein